MHPAKYIFVSTHYFLFSYGQIIDSCRIVVSHLCQHLGFPFIYVFVLARLYPLCYALLSDADYLYFYEQAQYLRKVFGCSRHLTDNVDILFVYKGLHAQYLVASFGIH